MVRVDRWGYMTCDTAEEACWRLIDWKAFDVARMLFPQEFATELANGEADIRRHHEY